MRRSKPSLVLLWLLAVLLAATAQLPVAASEEPTPPAGGPTADDAAAEEPSGAEDAPDEGTPAEDAEAPAEDADASAEDAPGDGAPADDAPADDAPADDAPADDAPADDAPAEDAAAEDDADAATFRTAAEPPAEGFPIRSGVRQVGTPTPDVVFTGSGWGHGVGMSQYGAYNMAKQGFSAAEILQHYYPGTAVGTDDRSSERIRVNLEAQVASASLEVPSDQQPIEWRHCQPREGTTETTDYRVTDCALDEPLEADPDSEAYYVQQPGTMLRVCPWNGETLDADGAVVTPEESVPGLMLVPETTSDQADCADLETALAEAVATTDRPVLRAYHHGIRVRSRVNASATGRLYEHGWQDFHRKTFGIDVVQDVDTVERYLEGLAESIRSWGLNGPEALQAQAITGRTYALRAKGAPRGLRAGTRACSCDLLDTPADQVYAGRDFALAQYGDLWVDAVEATATEVLRYDGQLAQTYYSSSHGGGRSEANEESWAYGNTPVPYLRSVADPYSMNEPHSFRAWTSRATHAAFAAHVSTGQPQALARVERVEILNRTTGGTPKEVRVTGVTADGATTSFVFTHRSNDSATLREKQVAGASFRVNLPTTGHPAAAGSRLPSSQIQRIGFGPFTDDDGITHEYSITWAALAGVASGTSETTFDPGTEVTRAQMATFIFNTFEIPEPTIRGQFTDVPASATHSRAIDALAEAGVASGVGEGRFAPGDPVTRDQMATFIARAAGLSTEAPAEDPFEDVPAGSTHAGAVASVAEAGITAGCAAGENRYCPRDPVSRQQMASFLRRTATS